MFAIYDIDGIRFRGPLEELERQRSSVRRRPPVNSIDGDEQSQWSGSQAGHNHKGLAAYQKMLSSRNMVEPLVHIQQIMSSPVVTIKETASISQVWRRLRDEKLRQLIVVNDQGRLAGLISDRDILHHITVIDDAVEIRHDAPVREVMPQETITTDVMSDIRRVARVMAFSHLDALPVLDEDKLVGIVTRGDILRGFADNPKLNLWA